MNHSRFSILLSLILVVSASLPSLVAAKSEKGDGEVIGDFSPGGMVLTITSQSELEELWGLVIDYCDGSREEILKYPFRIKFRAPLGSKGYSFYADKPMRQVLIKTLPLVENGKRPDDFRYTVARRKCGNPDPTPKLYCHDVQVEPMIYRSWEGIPIAFKSTRHVVRAGLRFPGVDGLALTRQPEFNPRRYFPSIKYDPANHTWTGTFSSIWVPVGKYEKVVLVVQDDFGQQAKCPVGKISVQP